MTIPRSAHGSIPRNYSRRNEVKPPQLAAVIVALQPVEVPAQISEIVSTRNRKVIEPHHRRALSQTMTIHRLLKNTTFGPEEIARLVAAYEGALRALGLKDRSDPITQLVAEKIIAVGRLGIEDPAEIAKLAVKELGGH